MTAASERDKSELPHRPVPQKGQPLLAISLIPITALANARTALTSQQWRAVARRTYSKAGHRCEICAAGGEMNCHELWRFLDGEGVQRLEALLCLDRRCHHAVHLGYTRRRSGSDSVAAAALAHLAAMNHWSVPEAAAYARRELLICQARSQRTWRLDLSLLREYGIELPDRDAITLGIRDTRDMASQTTGPEQFSPPPGDRTWWRRLLGTA